MNEEGMKRKTIFHNSSAVKQNTPKYDALLGFKHNKPTQNAGAEVADLIKQGLLMQYLIK